MSLNKILPKIINIIKLKNYIKNNYWNYNLKFENDKEILSYLFKSRDIHNYAKNNLIDNNKNIYQKLIRTYLF